MITRRNSRILTNSAYIWILRFSLENDNWGKNESFEISRKSIVRVSLLIVSQNRNFHQKGRIWIPVKKICSDTIFIRLGVTLTRNLGISSITWSENFARVNLFFWVEIWIYKIVIFSILDTFGFLPG